MATRESPAAYISLEDLPPNWATSIPLNGKQKRAAVVRKAVEFVRGEIFPKLEPELDLYAVMERITEPIRHHLERAGITLSEAQEVQLEESLDDAWKEHVLGTEDAQKYIRDNPMQHKKKQKGGKNTAWPYNSKRR